GVEGGARRIPEPRRPRHGRRARHRRPRRRPRLRPQDRRRDAGRNTEGSRRAACLPWPAARGGRGLMATMLETFPAACRGRCRDSADHVALREKRLGIWREHTWADYYARAREFGLGLVALGLEAGDRVAIQSEDRPEWLFSEIGAICVGATSLGVYSTSPPAEVEYLLAHSGARFIVAEDQEQVDK